MGRPANRPPSEYGQHLAALRTAAGLTQQQLAQRLGVPQSNIAFWERAEKPPRGEIVPRLAQALGVSADTVLGIEKPASKKNGATGAPPGPQGRVRKVFDAVSRLPRRQQTKIIEVVEAMIDKVSGP